MWLETDSAFIDLAALVDQILHNVSLGEYAVDKTNGDIAGDFENHF